MEYRIVKDGILRTGDAAWIPLDPNNNDYQIYFPWDIHGNEPSTEYKSEPSEG